MRNAIVLDDEWNMGIPLKVPMAVHTGRFLCLRGQIDVDANARSCNPDDVLAQARACAGHILKTLEKAAPDGPWIPRLLTVYIVPRPGRDMAEVEALLRDMLPMGATLPIVTVPIPWLYYPGIDIEIDLIASRGDRAEAEAVRVTGFDGFAGQGADISFAAGTVAASADLGEVCRELLKTLPQEARVQAFVQVGSRAEFEASLPSGVAGVEFLPCIIPGSNARRITLQAMSSPVAKRVIDQDGILVRQFGEVAILDAAGIAEDPSSTSDLPSQTKDMMERTRAALADLSLGFGNVLKGTVFYVGDDTDEALYSNLRVRDGYYSHPGPASTGVPFAEPSGDGSLIRMSLLLSTLKKDRQ